MDWSIILENLTVLQSCLSEVIYAPGKWTCEQESHHIFTKDFMLWRGRCKNVSYDLSRHLKYFSRCRVFNFGKPCCMFTTFMNSWCNLKLVCTRNHPAFLRFLYFRHMYSWVHKLSLYKQGSCWCAPKMCFYPTHVKTWYKTNQTLNKM